MKIIVLVFLTVVLSSCSYHLFADSTNNSLSLSLPSGSSGYQSDSFRDSNGNTCTMAIGSATQLELGITGLIDSADLTRRRISNLGIYSKIIIPLGRRSKGSRLDCDLLYQLQIKRQTLEIQKLTQEINSLKSLQFED